MTVTAKRWFIGVIIFAILMTIYAGIAEYRYIDLLRTYEIETTMNK